MAIFGRELIGREVVDSHGEVLGQLIDIVFDNQLGAITEFLVKIGMDLDANLLPWLAKDGIVVCLWLKFQGLQPKFILLAETSLKRPLKYVF